MAFKLLLILSAILGICMSSAAATRNFSALGGLSLNDTTQDADLLENLPGHATERVAEWAAPFIPAECYSQLTQYFNFSTLDIEVREVHYEDCRVPWVLCRHRNASVSWDEMQDTFGHLPLGMRSYIRHILLVPDPGHDHMIDWELGSTLMFHDSFFVLSAMIHEASHALDAFARRDLAGNASRVSQTQAWTDAWANDTALPSAYAEISPVEAFAEAGRLAVLDMVVPGGGLDRFGDWTAARNQVEAYKAWFGNVIFPRDMADYHAQVRMCLSRKPSSTVLFKEDGRPLIVSPDERRGGKAPWLA